MDDPTLFGASTIEGPRSQISVPISAQLQFITVPKTEWCHIRDAASRQMQFPFPWFNNAGVFLLGIVPAAVIFLIGWGPIYDGLAPDLRNRYGLVPGLVIVGTIALAALGIFFLFLDHEMHKHVASDAESIVSLMDKVSPPDA